MSPLDRMSLYLNSGNVFSVLGGLNDAKNYYENASITSFSIVIASLLSDWRVI